MVFYCKKPVVIEAAQFTGDNVAQVRAELGMGETHFYYLEEEDRVENPDARATLYVAANWVWIEVVPGEWIMKDALGYYPCKDSVFQESYEEL